MIFGIDKIPSERPALAGSAGERFSYGQLRQIVCRFANALPQRSLVFCLCRNVPEAVFGYLGVLDHGSVALLLGDNIDPVQLKGLEETYRPAYYWAPSEHFPEKAALLTECGYGLFSTDHSPYDLDPELALLLSTSGSTGSPKLIRLSRKNLESNAASIAEYLELNENERPVTVLPMQYTFGLSVINSHLLSGACILMTTESIVRQDFWDFLSREKGTSLSGVPYTYELLRRIHFPERDDTGSITSMIQAGGHLPTELQQFYGTWALENSVRFYVMYGQTEATARMSYLPWQDTLNKIGSIGIAIPGGRFEIQEEDGTVVTEPDVTGELVYYGDNVSLGYAFCTDDLSKPDENRGVLHTGDMAAVDCDGYYYIKGRLNRFVKLYGIRIGLDECEELLKRLDEDAIFACTGSDERMVIFTDSASYEKIPAFLSDVTGVNVRAFESRYLTQIPVKDTGKIDHSALKALI